MSVHICSDILTLKTRLENRLQWWTTAWHPAVGDPHQWSTDHWSRTERFGFHWREAFTLKNSINDALHPGFKISPHPLTDDWGKRRLARVTSASSSIEMLSSAPCRRILVYRSQWKLSKFVSKFLCRSSPMPKFVYPPTIMLEAKRGWLCDARPITTPTFTKHLGNTFNRS